jgi:hypothetical protein
VNSRPDRKTRAWSGLITRGVVTAILLMTSSMLLYDSTTNTLLPRDPSTGRTMGCYTLVEFAVGATTPTVWVRPLELLMSVISLRLIAAVLRGRVRPGPLGVCGP